MTRYPPDRYVVRYEGSPLLYRNDSRKIESSPGRDIIDATPSADGMYLEATGPVRNIEVIPEQHETLYDTGEMFHPLFLEKLKPFKAIRFMEWQRTNYGSNQGSWGKRPKVTDAFWSTKKGVPLEVIINLCNQTQKAPYFNMPHASNLTYNREFSRMVEENLCPNLPVYVELSNEVWNGSYAYAPQQQYMMSQGRKLWPTSTDPDWSLGFQWYTQRASQLGNIWKQRLGDRVTFVLAAQAANLGVAQLELNALPTNHSIGALAIAPYFGSAFTGTLDDFFNTHVPQDIADAMEMVKAHKTLADQYGLELIAYEGGPGYVAENDPVMTDFFIQANRDPRMGTATLDYLNQWKDNGGGLFMYFTVIGSSGKWGMFGSIESAMQKTHPKWEAIKDYAGPVGGNLNAVTYWSSDMTFLNAFKVGEEWIPQKPGSWGQGSPLDVDAEGWINSVPVGERAGVIMFKGFPVVN